MQILRPIISGLQLKDCRFCDSDFLFGGGDFFCGGLHIGVLSGFDFCGDSPIGRKLAFEEAERTILLRLARTIAAG